MLGIYDGQGNLQVGTGKGTKSAPSAISVGTGATLILAANSQRKSALIGNNNATGGATLFLGRDATVTVSNGYPLAAGASFTDASTKDAWYGIVASGSCDARVLEIS